MDDLDTCPNDPENDADGDLICVGEGYRSPKVGDNDNCPDKANGPNEAGIPNVGNQLDTDEDGIGDACENSSAAGKPCKDCITITDTDGDGIADTAEKTCGSLNCKDYNDCDNDNISDGGTDPDGTGPILKGPDNCLCVQNTNQLDTDGD